MSTTPSQTSFAYRAQTATGQPISGTLDATSAPEAGETLAGMGLRVVEIDPLPSPPRPKPLRGEDFTAFNQQLAQLTSAGLPIEEGLRLIAQDMRSGRLSETVRQIAADLESGTPLAQAFDKRRGRLPALYGRLIDAGVKTNNLPGMLLNLGRHLELVQRLRGVLWRAASYPLMVLLGMVGVMTFLTIIVLPQFRQIFLDFHTELPAITQVVMGLADHGAAILIALATVIVGVPVLWWAAGLLGWQAALVDWVVLPLPLVGPVIQRNMVARWCDAVSLGVTAGLDLPASIDLAANAIPSPALRRDSQLLADSLRAGQPLPPRRGDVLPATVPAMMRLSAEHNDLAAGLANLSQMYQQQAETRLSAIPAVLTPLFLVGTAIMIGMIVTALFAPILSLIGAVSGGGK